MTKMKSFSITNVPAKAWYKYRTLCRMTGDGSGLEGLRRHIVEAVAQAEADGIVLTIRRRHKDKV